MVTAFYFILKRNLQTIHSRVKEEIDGNQVHKIILSEQVSFLNRGSLQDALQHVKNGEHVEIDGTKSVSIPYDIFDMVQEFESTAHERDIDVKLLGFTPEKVG
jgi:carbonic anhydrase